MTPVEFGNPPVPPSVRRHLSRVLSPVVPVSSGSPPNAPSVQRHLQPSKPAVKVQVGNGWAAVDKHLATLKRVYMGAYVIPVVQKHVAKQG